MERDPAWSPDGKWVAYFSDESGEYQLCMKSPDGMSEPKRSAWAASRRYYTRLCGRRTARRSRFTDKRLNVWYVDLAKGTPVKVDSDTYDAPQRTLDPVWSPDSRWIAYSKNFPARCTPCLPTLWSKPRALQLTDGLSDARHPAFDQKGQYLYFTASTDAGPTTGWLDLSSINRSGHAQRVPDCPPQRPAFAVGPGER